MARRDYLNDPNAPGANSIAVATSAFVQDEERRILMIRRTDNNLFSIPGGQIEPGETLTQCAVREVKEETGMDIDITGLIGIYSNPGHIVAYNDGEVRQEFSICFRGEPVGGEPRTSDESSEVHWINAKGLDKLPIHESIRLRIDHALSSRTTPYFT